MCKCPKHLQKLLVFSTNIILPTNYFMMKNQSKLFSFSCDVSTSIEVTFISDPISWNEMRFQTCFNKITSESKHLKLP